MNAVLGELSAIQSAIDDASKVLGAQINMAEEMARASVARKVQPRIAFRFATPVFDSHVGRIGLLNPDVSYRVTNLYGRVLSFGTQSQDNIPEMDPSLAARVMRSVEDNFQVLKREIEDVQLALETISSTYRVHGTPSQHL